jgi:CheY-like chemotaxis protein
MVLVAHDSEVVRNSITSVLVDAGFAVDSAVDGKEALRKVAEIKPRAMVLDVGLPGIYGFELCERLKGSQETSDIKIVLLSSVYDKRRYKRTPVTLYGADDYIEKHHIPDLLPLKLRKLIFPDEFSAPPNPGDGHTELPEMARPPAREFKPSQLPERPVQDETKLADTSLAPVLQKAGPPDAQEGSSVLPDSFSLDASIFQKEECDIPRVDAGDPEAVEKARRFARIIVSDIALYNQEAVAEGLKKGTFYELLKTDITEGREIYEKRVPKTIREQKDYYQEAFVNFIKAQGKNVR